MGFLNHSTNNIIIDAVLTEIGREALSEGGARSEISYFRLGDDEVDYEVIKQYGRVIGKEKIEKNTPIFEAVTNENFALKYPLRNLRTNTNSLSVFPNMVLKNSSDTFRLSSNANSTTSRTIEFKTFVNQDAGFELDSSVVDSTVTVKVFDKLLRVNNQESVLVDGIRIYENVSVTSSTLDFIGQVQGSIDITTLNVVTDSTYQYYSTSGDSSLIRTQVEIIGNTSGARLIVPVEITSNTVS